MTVFDQNGATEQQKKVATESQEEHPRNSQSRNAAVSRMNEDYITELSEKMEGRVTRKLPQEFSRTESRLPGALSKLDEFNLNPQVWAQSGNVAGTSRNSNTESQEPKVDSSQIDPSPQVGTSTYQVPQSTNTNPEEASYNPLFCLPRSSE